MRKEARENVTVNVASVQGYHQRNTGAVSYAYQGFRQNKYFASDRPILLDANFNRPNGESLKGYGLEIETQCNGITNQRVLADVFDKIIFDLFPPDLFKMQDDGSLGGRTSAECITQVMTKAFIRNHYRDFKAMYNTYFPAFDISADSANTACGMHVNISNACFGDSPEKQELAIRKLFYIVNRHYDLCCSLFYRKGSTRYCGRMRYDNIKTVSLSAFYSDHGCAFNLGHFGEGRIELRLVGGQRNYACFRNTMESVFFLVDRVKKLSWDDCDKVAEIFKGCNQYVYDRLTVCPVNHEDMVKIAGTVKREELL